MAGVNGEPPEHDFLLIGTGGNYVHGQGQAREICLGSGTSFIIGHTRPSGLDFSVIRAGRGWRNDSVRRKPL